MTFISVTRLRLRSIRFLPGFVPHAMRSRTQAARVAGFRGGTLLMDRLAFWTLTAWDDGASMRAYMLAGPHRIAMPRLVRWCDEASVVHWEQKEEALPGWPEAVRRMREECRPSRVRYPSPQHEGWHSAPRRWLRPRRYARARPARSDLAWHSPARWQRAVVPTRKHDHRLLAPGDVQTPLKI